MARLRLILAVLALSWFLPSPAAQAHGYRYQTGPATAYHRCDGSAQQTASGLKPTTWFRGWQLGIVAHNGLPFGTWIEMVSPPQVNGRKYFQVEDRGASGYFLIDIWAPSCTFMERWGKPMVKIRIIPKHHLYKGRPEGGWEFKP